MEARNSPWLFRITTPLLDSSNIAPKKIYEGLAKTGLAGHSIRLE